MEGDKVLGGPLGDRMVVASTTDSQGNLWLATSHGVIKYDGKQFTTYTTEDGLLVNDILDVREDSQGNLWFATWGGGVALYNGETFQAITTKHGLVHNNVRSIFEDSREDMCFATDGGITKYTLRTDILPRIKLTKIIANEVYTDFDEELLLPPKVRHLVFEYQGVSHQRVNLLYTHKLEGYEGDWSQPSTEEQVRYDELRPGNYTFLVKALREGSAYSNPPAVVKFTIMQPFWTQSRFYLPVSVGGVILAAFVFLITRLVIQWRRAATLRAELRQKEEAEIQRVKKELSDARDMQMGLLPKAAPHIDEFELAGASLPATEVGGDFYDYLTLRDNLVGITLADVSGKGLRGAMNAVLTNGMLREVVQLESRVDAILARLNAAVVVPSFLLGFISHIDRWAKMPAKFYIWAVILLVVAIAGGVIIALRMVKKEMALAQLKSDFVSNVSHELKTPLTSINMFIEMLLLKLYENEAEAEEYLRVIQKESNRLIRLVERVLDFSRIEKGKKEFHYKQESISEVILSTVETFRAQLVENECEITVNLMDNLPQLQIDRDAISEALLNL